MYSGSKISMPLGQAGIMTDNAPALIPKEKLIDSNNITIENGTLELARGTRIINKHASGTPNSPLPAGIVAVYDWWPSDFIQRTVAVCKNGRVYCFSDDYNFVEVTPIGSAPVTLTVNSQTHIVQAGAETLNRQRKLFIFTGNDPVQVITGDGITRSNLANPATDWSSGNYPAFGFIYRSRLFALGNAGDRHRAYSSKVTDHENFSDVSNFQSPVFPGDGEGLLCGWVFKGKQFLAKYPTGIYSLNDSTGTDGTGWYYQKISDSFGVASPHSICPFVDDVLLASQTGGIVSMTAAFQLGDVQMADLLRNLKVEQCIRDKMSQIGSTDRWSIYYEDKKQAYFTYRSKSGSRNDRLAVIDINRGQAELFLFSKDQPNCLALRKDAYGVKRVIYGDDSGYINELDQSTHQAQGSGYAFLAQLPHLDFGDTNNKLFEFLELTYEPTGNVALKCDVIVDGRLRQTLSFLPYYERVLGEADGDTDPWDFVLDTTTLSGRFQRSIRKPLKSCFGRSISFKFYTTSVEYADSINYKLDVATVYFRPAAENQKANT